MSQVFQANRFGKPLNQSLLLEFIKVMDLHLTTQKYDFYGFIQEGRNYETNGLPYSEILAFKDRILEKRKRSVMLGNAAVVLREVFTRGEIGMIYSRWRTYQRCKHFFG